MAATDRVQQILSWYSSENPGTLTNIARLLNHGTPSSGRTPTRSSCSPT